MNRFPDATSALLVVVLSMAMGCSDAPTPAPAPAAPASPDVSANAPVDSVLDGPIGDSTASLHPWIRGVLDSMVQTETAILTSIRTASQDGFDRIVFEFAAGPVPGFHISYIDRPVRQCGSGATVPMAGDGWLEVRFFPAYGHTEAGQPTVRERNRVLSLKNVRQLAQTCDFEADVTWVAGVLSPNDFRVMRLAGPPRLVVDIRHR